MFYITRLIIFSLFISGCCTVPLLDGKHRCQLKSNVGNNSTIAVLELHQHLVLNCSTTQKNSSNFTFEWKHEHYVIKTGSTVDIQDVAWNHAGKFECIVKQNGSLEKCDFTVIVKTLPHVRITRPDVLRNTLIVVCQVKGYFKPNQVIWYKDNKQIFPNDMGYSLKNETKSDFSFLSKLQRSHVSLSDSGNYSCEARNIYGTSPRTYHYITKTVINGYLFKKCPEFKNKTRNIDVTIRLGSSTSLLCEVMYTTKFPELFILWKIENGSQVNIGFNSTKNIYKKGGSKNGNEIINYTIVNADENDAGKYQCDFDFMFTFHCPKSLHKVFNVKVIDFSRENKKKQNLVVVIVVSVTGALCGIALIIYVSHLRRKLKAQLYDSCPNDQPELRWDVFVSYSSYDFIWVNDLCKMLEQPPFNLIVCLHQRDWELGRSLQDNMVDSIYCSHKTLIILSKHYLQSDYCMQELQLAMHSEIASEHVRRKDRIVLIKIDDVSTQRLPRVLRQKSYLDCFDPEHKKHFKTNLLRVLPQRKLEEEREGEENRESFNEASGSEMRLEDLPVD